MYYDFSCFNVKRGYVVCKQPSHNKFENSETLINNIV